MDFRERLERLELSQQETARWLQVTDRTIRRWSTPTARQEAPKAVLALLALMERYKLTPAKVDKFLDA